MNDLERIHSFLLRFPGTSEEFPFGPEAAVYKVAGRMFAILSPDDVPASMNLKCDPDHAVELREAHAAILPGYHMNKRHWNTLKLDGTLPDHFVEELVQHSFDLVLAGHSRRVRDRVLGESD